MKWNADLWQHYIDPGRDTRNIFDKDGNFSAFPFTDWMHKYDDAAPAAEPIYSDFSPYNINFSYYDSPNSNTAPNNASSKTAGETEASPWETALNNLFTTIDTKATAKHSSTDGAHSFAVYKHTSFPDLEVVFDLRAPAFRTADENGNTLVSSIYFAKTTEMGKDVVSYNLYTTPDGMTADRQFVQYAEPFDSAFLAYDFEAPSTYQPFGISAENMGPVTAGELQTANYYARGAEAGIVFEAGYEGGYDGGYDAGFAGGMLAITSGYSSEGAGMIGSGYGGEAGGGLYGGGGEGGGDGGGGGD